MSFRVEWHTGQRWETVAFVERRSHIAKRHHATVAEGFAMLRGSGRVVPEVLARLRVISCHPRARQRQLYVVDPHTRQSESRMRYQSVRVEMPHPDGKGRCKLTDVESGLDLRGVQAVDLHIEGPAAQSTLKLTLIEPGMMVAMAPELEGMMPDHLRELRRLSVLPELRKEKADILVRLADDLEAAMCRFMNLTRGNG